MPLMKIPIYIADAFTSEPFGEIASILDPGHHRNKLCRLCSLRSPSAGNPAAVCLLSTDISDELKQQIAAEMNLSETAFVTPRGLYVI